MQTCDNVISLVTTWWWNSGIWEAKKIANPDFVDDDSLYKYQERWPCRAKVVFFWPDLRRGETT